LEVLVVLSCLVHCFQLPGFYFNPDKKRYFRIVPGHGSVIAGAVTSRDVASKTRQKQSPPAFHSVQRQRVHALQSCFVSTFQNLQIGQATAYNVRSQILSGIVRNLAWHNVLSVSPVREHRHDLVNIDDSYVKQIFCTSDDNQLICQWDLDYHFHCPLVDASHSALQCIEVSGAAESCSECTMLHCRPVGYLQSAMRIDSIMAACVAPTDIFPECHRTPVLYAADAHPRWFVTETATVAVLDSLDSVDDGVHDNDDAQSQASYIFRARQPNSFRTFYIGKKWVWSCAWSPGLSNEFAVGTEKLAYVFNANTGKCFALDTKSSDVLSLAYTSPVSVRVLCLGD